jgi:hypothetical protein
MRNLVLSDVGGYVPGGVASPATLRSPPPASGTFPVTIPTGVAAADGASCHAACQ